MAGGYDAVGVTDEVMSIDLGFLEASGLQAVAAVQREAQALGELEDELNEQELADELEPESLVERGGSGASDAGGAAAVPEVVAEEVHASKEMSVESTAADEALPVALQFTDHQEAVQEAAWSRGGANGDGSGAPLPQTGFKLLDAERQPNIKTLPEEIMLRLRGQLREAAVRVLGVTEAAATEYTERLSQGTLVTSFLLAQLDLRMRTDASTELAVRLFQVQDPLLGRAVERMDQLEERLSQQSGVLDRVLGDLQQVRETSSVLEQGLAYSIADREQNFLRGSRNIEDAPITHKDALFLRDRMRQLTATQVRAEQETAGRAVKRS